MCFARENQTAPLAFLKKIFLVNKSCIFTVSHFMPSFLVVKYCIFDSTEVNVQLYSTYQTLTLHRIHFTALSVCDYVFTFVCVFGLCF